jgi:hypothetical protein
MSMTMTTPPLLPVATNNGTPATLAPLELPSKLVTALLQLASQTPQGRALLDGYLLAKGYDEVPCTLVGTATVVPTSAPIGPPGGRG